MAPNNKVWSLAGFGGVSFFLLGAALQHTTYSQEMWALAILLWSGSVCSTLLRGYLFSPLREFGESTPLPVDVEVQADRVVEIESDNIEAYSTGLLRRTIVVSSQATDELSQKELSALIAHEEGHFRHNHIRILYLFKGLWLTAGTLIMLEITSQWGLSAFACWGGLLLGDLLISKAWLRLGEFQADKHAARKTSIECCLSLLRRLEQNTDRTVTFDDRLTSTHPPLGDRLEFIERRRSN